MMAQIDTESVNAALKAVKLRKARYATFKIKNEAGSPIQVTTDKLGERKTNKDDFFKDLPDTQPRFTVYDYEFKTADGRATSTLYFIYWVPQNSNQMDKILFSTSKTSFVQILDGFQHKTCEKMKQVQELLEKEELSGK